MRALITILIISLGSIKISTCPEPPRMNINFQYDGSIKDVMPIIKGYLEEQKYDIIHYAPESGFILTDYKLFKLNTGKVYLSLSININDLVVIVDEAHNLPDRVRRGMQSRLTPTMVRNASSEVEEHLGNLQKVATLTESMNDSVELKRWSLEVCKEFRHVLNREFKSLISELAGEKEMQIQAKDVLSWLEEAFDKVSAHVSQSRLTGNGLMFANPDKKIRLRLFKELLETNEVDVDEEGDNEPSAHLLSQQIDVLERFGNGSALCLVFDGQGRDGRIITHLLDAGLVAGPIFERVSGAILMSGTLNPPNMFADLLGITKETRGQLILPSPFAKERRPIVVATDVTTLYRERGVENTEKMRNHGRKSEKSQEDLADEVAVGHVALEVDDRPRDFDAVIEPRAEEQTAELRRAAGQHQAARPQGGVAPHEAGRRGGRVRAAAASAL